MTPGPSQSVRPNAAPAALPLDALLRQAWRDPARLSAALEQLAAAHGLTAAGLYATAGGDFILQAAGGPERERLPARLAVQSGGPWAEALRLRSPRYLPATAAAGEPSPARAAFPAWIEATGQDEETAEWILFTESAAELAMDARHALAVAAEALAEAGQSHRAWAAARAGERRWEGLFTQLPVWCQTEHADGTIADINPAGLELLGRERDQVVGRRLAEFYPPQSPLPAASGTDPDAPPLPAEIQVSPRHGAPLTLRLYPQPEPGEGRAAGRRSVLVNVTAERELERQLAEAQKMQAVGTLAAGIAHDFNNLLTTVLGQIELLRLRHARALPEDALDRLARMEKAARRAAGLIAQLLAFSRRDPQQMGPVEVWAAVLATVELLRHGLPENIEIRRESQLPQARIWGSLGQLQQALVNAAANAVAAMPEGGALTLALALAPAPPRAGRATPPSPEAPGWAVLSIADTGVGMTEAVRQRAFEPFFTTKPSSENSGLGLAIVYGIVQAHHGYAELESAPGHGTTLRLYFPLLTAEAAAAVPESAAAGGAERILLVEDDAAVADTTAQMLTSSGYQVAVAHRPSEALEQLRQAAQPFDLIMTDVTMPEMTGYQLADRVRAEFGPMRTLFVTGYDLQSAPVSSSRFLLQKPLNLRTLAAAVREALAAELA